MKKYLLFLTFITVSAPVFSQSASNKEAVEKMKAAGYSGHFTYKTEENKNVNVNYSFTPLEPVASVNFMLHTPNPRPLWFQVTNKAGKVVAEWKPAEAKYLHRGTLDVSSLKAGEYTYNIYWDKTLAYSIPFRKK